MNPRHHCLQLKKQNNMTQFTSFVSIGSVVKQLSNNNIIIEKQSIVTSSIYLDLKTVQEPVACTFTLGLLIRGEIEPVSRNSVPSDRGNYITLLGNMFLCLLGHCLFKHEMQTRIVFISRAFHGRFNLLARSSWTDKTALPSRKPTSTDCTILC